MDSKWEFNPYCLAGRNGSGKSNVMEALAAIFYHIECIYLGYRPEGFEADEDNPNGFNSEVSFPDAYELEYLVPVPNELQLLKVVQPLSEPGTVHVTATKKVGERPILSIANSDFFFEKESEQLDRELIKSILPEYIIGYSSGENEILSLPFFKMRFIQYDEYLDKLTNDLDYSKPESRFVYIDDYFNQAVLLCNYLLNEPEMLTPFKKEIGLHDIKSFRLIIKQHWQVLIHPDAYFLSASDAESQKKQKELTLLLKSSIEKLILCSTTSYFDEETKERYLDFHVDEACREAFRMHFGTALELFSTLQILLGLNYYQIKRQLKEHIYQTQNIYINKDVVPAPLEEERIIRFKDLVLKKDGVDDIIYTKSLSDGEYQLLHSIGLCLLFRNTNSLFLLDEPETHLNPDWRASFISILKECLKTEKELVLRDILITSHSPFIISDTRKEYVLVFKKDTGNDNVICERPDFKTFGASVNQITIKVFGQQETIGDHAKDELNKLYGRLDADEEIDLLIDEVNREFGDSVEKVLFINKALDKKEGETLN